MSEPSVPASFNPRRRRFLQLAALSAGAVTIGCEAPKGELKAQSRARLAEDYASAYESWYATACRGCAAGCGLIVRVVGGRAVKVEGNPAHPLNLGRSCARAQALVQEQYHPDRIRQPLLRVGERGAGRFVPLSWDEALDRLAGRLRELQPAGRGGEVAMLSGPQSGHRALLLDHFTRALGASWLRLDPLSEAPVREAARRVFGAERLPHFDLQNAAYVLSLGADFLGTWLSPVHYGGQYGVFRQGSYALDGFQPRHESGRPRGYLVQVEPRFSTTAAGADEWVWVRPGREGLLALGLAQVILSEGLADPAGAGAFGDRAALDNYRPEQVAAETGVSAERIRRLARDFAARRPSLALVGGPAVAQPNGTEAAAAAFALNLLVGNVNRPGGVLLNPAPPIEGLPAELPPSGLADWRALVERLDGGQLQAVLVQEADPVHDLPAAIGVEAALGRAPFIASFASFMDETTALADLVLPSNLPLESWGDAVPDPQPGRPVLTLQQPVVRPLHDTRAASDVLLILAEEVGGPLAAALPWPTFKDLLREGAARLDRGSGAGDEAAFERVWVELLQRGGWWAPAGEGGMGRRGDGGMGGSGPAFSPSPLLPFSPSQASDEYPLHLVVFPHHTLGAGAGAHLPWLQATPDPVTTVTWQTWVEVGPRLGAELGLREGDVVAVETPHGRLEAPVYLNPAASPEVIGVPMGQGHRGYGRWAERRGVNPMAILAPLADAATGALAYAATRARLVKTGRRTALPKLEGTVPARQLEHEPVLKVVRE